MLSTIAFLCLASANAIGAYSTSEGQAAVRGMRASELVDVDTAFEAFITEYQRPYGNDPQLKARKKANFVANMAKAKELEALDPSAHYGVNKYSDEDLEELHERRRNSFGINTQRVTPTGETIPFRELNVSQVDTSVAARFKRSHPRAAKERKFVAAAHRAAMEGSDYGLSEEHARAMEAAATADAIDWRDLGVVSPVKQQGNCGSCWSFATTGNIEALWVISGNNKTLLSEEELLACDVQSGNDACYGGLMQAAFWWILKYRSGYISQAATYPFTSGSGYTAPCNFNKSRPGAYIYDYADVKPQESSIVAVVSQLGPVSVGVDSTSWELYNGGIMSTSCSNRKLDHAVLIVGYDTTFTRPYWIVKNSWGTDWGENGYLRIAMGNNYCLLADIPSTALVPQGARELPEVAPTTPEPSRTSPLAAQVASVILGLAALVLALL